MFSSCALPPSINYRNLNLIVESSVNECVTSQLRLRSAQKASTLVKVMFTGISNTAQLEKVSLFVAQLEEVK